MLNSTDRRLQVFRGTYRPGELPVILLLARLSALQNWQLLIVGTGMIFCLCLSQGASAQATIDWDTYIITHNGQPLIGTPMVTADPWGNVHVFVSGWAGSDRPTNVPNATNAILYTYLDDGVWSDPIDILAQTGDSLVIFQVAYNSSTNQLYVLWQDGRDLKLSYSPLDGASSAWSWQTQTIFTGINFSGTLSATDDNVLHVVYDDNARNIWYVNSRDDGLSWSPPVSIYATERSDIALTASRLIADHRGTLHLIGTESAEDFGWNQVAVWYARSTDMGKSWTTTDLGRRNDGEKSLGQPGIGLGIDDQVHVVWNRGAGSPDGRYFRWSADGGQTWSEAAELWPDTPHIAGGQAGAAFMLLDNAQVLHLLSAIEDTESQQLGLSGGIRYATWMGNDWSPSIHVTTCEFPDAVIAEGNTIHIVCKLYDGSDQVRYTRIRTQAPTLPTLPQPTVAAPTATLSAVIETAPTASQQMAITAKPTLNAGFAVDPPSSIDGQTGVLLMVLPAVGLVLIAVAWQIRRR